MMRSFRVWVALDARLPVFGDRFSISLVLLFVGLKFMLERASARRGTSRASSLKPSGFGRSPPQADSLCASRLLGSRCIVFAINSLRYDCRGYGDCIFTRGLWSASL